MWLVLSAFVVALLSVWFFFPKKPKHPVDLLPGPPSLPIIGTTLNFVTGKEAVFRIFNEMAEKNYPMYRTQQGEIRVAHPLNPQDLEIILTSNVNISKSHDYNFLKDWLGTGLLISTGEKWHSRRKLLTPAFHFSVLEQFVPIFCDKTRTLIEKLRNAATGNPDGVDIVPYVTRCALDIICQTAMGTELHAQDAQDSSYVAAVYEKGTLLIDSGGHDTTAIELSWTIYFLGKYTEVQSRCVEELEETFCGSDRDPNLTDLGNMKYLERVIKESLRLKPSVLSVSRLVKLTDHDFPAGTKLNLHIYNIHRNPEKFDPDRFLPVNCIGRHPYAYIPFSAGPRNCQRFAMLEMKEVLSTVLRHFRLETIDPEHHYEALPDLILRPKYGIKMRLYPRKDDHFDTQNMGSTINIKGATKTGKL